MKRKVAALRRDDRHNVTSALTGLGSCGFSEFPGPPFFSKTKGFWCFPLKAIAQNASHKATLESILLPIRAFCEYFSDETVDQSVGVSGRCASHGLLCLTSWSSYNITTQYTTHLSCGADDVLRVDKEGKTIKVVEPVEWVSISSVFSHLISVVKLITIRLRILLYIYIYRRQARSQRFLFWQWSPICNAVHQWHDIDLLKTLLAIFN